MCRKSVCFTGQKKKVIWAQTSLDHFVPGTHRPNMNHVSARLSAYPAPTSQGFPDSSLHHRRSRQGGFYIALFGHPVPNPNPSPHPLIPPMLPPSHLPASLPFPDLPTSPCDRLGRGRITIKSPHNVLGGHKSHVSVEAILTGPRQECGAGRGISWPAFILAYLNNRRQRTYRGIHRKRGMRRGGHRLITDGRRRALRK